MGDSLGRCSCRLHYEVWDRSVIGIGSVSKGDGRARDGRGDLGGGGRDARGRARRDGGRDAGERGCGLVD